jgi:HPt (histidine-containing phosphotransfer) domain-containing protein
MGVDGYLAKPFSAHDLVEAVRTVLSGESSSDASGFVTRHSLREARLASPESPVIDREKLLEQAGGDCDLLDEIIGMFLEDSPGLLEPLELAIQRGNARGLEHAAHKLKGTFGSLAASRAADAAYRLESIGGSGDLNEARGALDELREEIQCVENELRLLLGRSSARASA